MRNIYQSTRSNTPEDLTVINHRIPMTVLLKTFTVIKQFMMFVTLFTSKLDLNLRKKLIKYYIWSMAFYGAETWTLRAADQKYLEGLKCGAGEGWRRPVGPIM